MELNIYNLISEALLKVIVAIVIIVFGLIFGGFFSKLTRKILKELEINNILKKETKLRIPLEQTISSIVKYIIYFIALILALEELGMTTTILYIVLATILVILVLAVLLSFKDYLPNIVAGFVIHQKKNLQKGNNISIAGIEGEIIEITTTDVRIKTRNKDIIIIPNFMFLRNEVKIKKG